MEAGNGVGMIGTLFEAEVGVGATAALEPAAYTAELEAAAEAELSVRWEGAAAIVWRVSGESERIGRLSPAAVDSPRFNAGAAAAEELVAAAAGSFSCSWSRGVLPLEDVALWNAALLIPLITCTAPGEAGRVGVGEVVPLPVLLLMLAEEEDVVAPAVDEGWRRWLDMERALLLLLLLSSPIELERPATPARSRSARRVCKAAGTCAIACKWFIGERWALSQQKRRRSYLDEVDCFVFVVLGRRGLHCSSTTRATTSIQSHKRCNAISGLMRSLATIAVRAPRSCSRPKPIPSSETSLPERTHVIDKQLSVQCTHEN
jgi:hypothetical protein